jgi:hypothetical protein
MKKIKSSDLGETYSQSQITALARWEKIHSEGKWFWIFKRGAAWLASVLFLYGLGAMLYPTLFSFQKTQFYILFGMMGGFIASSIMEWSKMEANYKRANKSK